MALSFRKALALIVIHFSVMMAFPQMSSASFDDCRNAGEKLSRGARDTGRKIWGVWVCSSCGTQNSAKPKSKKEGLKCENCGSGREENEPFFLPDDLPKNAGGKITATAHDVNFSDQIESTIATQGKDWACPHCGTTNRQLELSCTSCGAGKDLNSPRSTPTPQLSDASSRNFNSADHYQHPSLWQAGKHWIIGGFLAATLAVGGIYWGTRTHEYSGTVAQTEWTHRIDVQRFTKVSKSQWREELTVLDPVMPINGVGERAGAFNLRNSRQEIHHYQKVFSHNETYYESVPYQVPDGHTTSYVNEGNGSFREVQTPKFRTEYRQEERTRAVYRDDPVYREKVDYDTHQWVSIHPDVSSGKNLKSASEATWPSYSLQTHDRVLKSTEYRAEVVYGPKGKKHQVPVADLNSLATWSLNEPVTVTQSNFGTVKKVSQNDGGQTVDIENLETPNR